jgi:hypothetical protein
MSTLRILSDLERVHEQFKAGLPTEIPVTDETRQWNLPAEPFVQLRTQLIGLVLPRYLGLLAKTTLRANEGPEEFLSRVAAEAVNRQDYLLAARARTTQAILREGRNQVSDPRVLALEEQARLFVSAANQENAGQYALAVCSYERALASGSDLVPGHVVGKRLAALQAAHPEQFREGYESFLNPNGMSFPQMAAQGPMRPPGPPRMPVLSVPPSSVPPLSPPSPTATSTP